MISAWKFVGVISLGASLGAITRWALSFHLNFVFPFIPLGTLVANIMGGFLVGVAYSVFAAIPTLSPEWRLLIITGFLGALTTFSTFSLEVWILIQQQRFGWAMLASCLHFFGSLLALFCGVILTNYILKQLG